MDDLVTVSSERSVWCNRTLNLRAIRAVGYDMDYTLVHYRTAEWERAAFERALGPLERRGWPVQGLTFDPASVIQGLAFDLELGNLVKATRFGYVIKAHHGTRPLTFDEQRSAYSSTFVDLSDPRWEFMNTLFSLSHANLFAQLVDLLDAGQAAGAPGVPRPAAHPPDGAGRGAQPERAEDPDHGQPGQVRGARPRAPADPAGPEDGGQEACCSSPTPTGSTRAP